MPKSSGCPADAPCMVCYDSHHHTSSSQGLWSEEEHDRFLEAMKRFPKGPWKDITAHVATRSVRQVQTHAQKYCEKLERRTRGLHKERKRVLRPEHRLDQDSNLGVCSGPRALAFDSASVAACEKEPIEAKTQHCASISPRSDSSQTRNQSESSGDDDASTSMRFFTIDLDEQCLAYLARVLGVDDEDGHAWALKDAFGAVLK